MNKNTEAIEAPARVTVGHGYQVHAALSYEYPGRTICGLTWTDEGEDFYQVTCSNCAGRLARNTKHRRAMQQLGTGA